MPQDDTIPQQTEGTEVLTLTITPTRSDSYLIVDFIGSGTLSASDTFGIAFFRDGTADSVGAGFGGVGSGSSISSLAARTYVSSGSTSSTTFKVRIGASSATIYVNGNSSGTRLFGGASISSLIIREIAP